MLTRDNDGVGLHITARACERSGSGKVAERERSGERGLQKGA